MNLLFEMPAMTFSPAVPLLFCDLAQPAVVAEPAEDITQPEPLALPPGTVLLTEDDLQARLDAASAEARQAAEQHWQAVAATESHRAAEVERTAVAHVCRAFAHSRERYFAELEGEVVKLAMEIAGKVLEREAAADRLLLREVARAALGRLAGVEGAVLQVPPGTEERWRRELRASGVRVQADPAMEKTDLRIVSSAGSAELGVGAQMAEIERGFAGLARRPA